MTDTAAARQTLTTVLTSSFRVPQDAVTDDATFTDLGLDSIAVVELTDLLGDALSREIPDGTLHAATTIAEAVTSLCAQTRT